mmetsp:Transcript_10543/g.34667  ORF Transcript_10543/g.34667 Transcript_10543/m.34667 type:complete len:106 (+) Transcript_10543:3-320(+)
MGKTVHATSELRQRAQVLQQLTQRVQEAQDRIRRDLTMRERIVARTSKPERLEASASVVRARCAAATEQAAMLEHAIIDMRERISDLEARLAIIRGEADAAGIAQ